MHESALKNAKKFIEKFVNEEYKILDVGSLNVNGTIKSLVPIKKNYVGLDVVEGPNVDCLIKDYKFPFSDEFFDIIMTSSCFEHCDFFWLIFLEMLRCLKKRGMIYVCAPSEGFEHKYPIDAYRFKSDFGLVLKKWACYNFYNIEIVEQYIDQSSLWKDNVIIFKKNIKLL